MEFMGLLEWLSSNYRFMHCGVPQGTILGPLLFLIYINDLPNCLSHSRARMFADDTHMISSSNNIKDINLYFNEDLLNVSEWLSANRLTLNSEPNSEPALALNNISVKRVSHTKSLAICILISTCPGMSTSVIWVKKLPPVEVL